MENSNKNQKLIGIGIVVVLLGAVVILSNFGSSQDEGSQDDTPMTSLEEVANQDIGLRLPPGQIMISMQNDLPDPDPLQIESGETMVRELLKLDDFDISGILQDIQLERGAEGTASARYRDGKYELVAEFQNLPPLKDGYFYEGWVVRQSPFEFVSTGKVNTVGGVYVNTYVSERDLLAYNFYVLTVEPDDGDPAPAEHIVEGYMNVVQQ